MSASLAIVKQQFRIIRRDPWFLAIMFGMPMIAMPLLKRTMAISLQASGYANATGAEQVVPGQVVMFGFFVGGSAGFCVFREHGWKTWDRLRASSATPTGLLFGFATPWVIIHVLFRMALFVAGDLALGLRLNGGSIFAALVLMLAYATCVIAIIMLTTATFRTVNRVFSIGRGCFCLNDC